MTATEEWTPQTACQLARERRARIAAAAERYQHAQLDRKPSIRATLMSDAAGLGPTFTIPTPPIGVEERLIQVKTIQLEVCADYGISRLDMLSRRRTANIVMPRQIAMFLAKELTLHSLPLIGHLFADRDHTTILHAVHKIGQMIQTDADLAARIERIRQRLTGDAR